MSALRRFEERVPRELRPGLEFYRQAFEGVHELDPRTIVALRERLHATFEAGQATAPRHDAIEIGERRVQAEGHPDGLYLRTYRRRDAKGTLPCIYYIHGGGMVLGGTRYDDAPCCAYADATRALVVSVEYRLAPEHPYPAGVEDCYAGLQQVAAHAGAFGVDPASIAVAGCSGGGVLAAAVALMARDRHGPPLCFQCLVYPMLDDRNQTPSAIEFRDVVSWGGRLNASAWKAVLGDRAGGDDVPSYAAPSRAKTLRGLPPAFLQVGELEVFRDECIEYAQRLMIDGVPCELHVHPGVYHSADAFNPATPVAMKMAAERFCALRRAFGAKEP